ncbi:hypothetical protein V2J09_009263 [Rumex salicifolius]
MSLVSKANIKLIAIIRIKKTRDICGFRYPRILGPENPSGPSSVDICRAFLTENAPSSTPGTWEKEIENQMHNQIKQRT